MQAGIDFTARCMAAEALANGGSGGTSDYTHLTNKPSINNVELSGNKTSANLGLQAEITGNVTISSDNVDDTGATNLFVTSSEKSTWNGKQDALAFDGIYDASTNKVATESTVYNEAANATLASGYTTDSSEVSITSATNINDAVEQLDYRTQTNKTNILLLEEMNGVKNLSPWSGGSISTSGYVVQNYPLVLPAGQYNVFFNTTATSSVGEVIFGDGSGRVGSAVFSHSTDRIVLAITLSRDSTTMTLTTSIGTTITNYMIITKAAYDAGFTDYQPYAMSNVELTKQRSTRRLGRWVTTFTVETPAFGATDEGGTITKVYIYMGGQNTGLSEYILASESVALVTGGAGVTYSISGSTVTFTTTSTCLAYAETLHFDIQFNKISGGGICKLQ